MFKYPAIFVTYTITLNLSVKFGIYFSIVVFIVGTVLAWPESGIPFESSANSSDGLLSLFEILKSI